MIVTAREKYIEQIKDSVHRFFNQAAGPDVSNVTVLIK